MKRLTVLLLAVLAVTLAGSPAVTPQALAALTSSNIPAHTHASTQQGGTFGSLSMSGTLSSTKACASGYTRLFVNYCLKNEEQAFVLTHGAVCTQLGTLSLSDAKAVLIQVYQQIDGTSLVTSYTSRLQVYGTQSSCTTAIGEVQLRVREDVATSLLLHASKAGVLIVPSSTSGQFFYKSTKGNAAAGTNNLIYVIGYFD